MKWKSRGRTKNTLIPPAIRRTKQCSVRLPIKTGSVSLFDIFGLPRPSVKDIIPSSPKILPILSSKEGGEFGEWRCQNVAKAVPHMVLTLEKGTFSISTAGVFGIDWLCSPPVPIFHVIHLRLTNRLTAKGRSSLIPSQICDKSI